MQTRILEINPKALFVPCANHSLNLVVVDVVVKINPNIPLKQRQSCTAKKYSSDTSERTEENSCLDSLQHANERCRKLYV